MKRLAELHTFNRKFMESLQEQQIDAIVFPPYGLPAVEHQSSGKVLDASGSCFLANLLGCPAGVVAAGRVRPGEEHADRGSKLDIAHRTASNTEKGSSGLPVGVQVIAPKWREDMVLAVMYALESHFQQNDDYPAMAENIATPAS